MVKERNFFFIDTDHLDDVPNRLYGFCIADAMSGGTVSLEDEKFPAEYPNGAYILVQNLGDRICISQDFNGACGIYMFRQGDYFAFSNSFLLLVDRLDTRFTLSLNDDYAKAYIVSGLSPLAFSETLVREIEVLPRNARVVISKVTRRMEMLSIDYGEHSVEIASEEGLRILDKWYAKWMCTVREIKAETDNMMCDLSGGFDSRLVFGLFVHAGIDLDSVWFQSHRNKLHTHEEDYAIASRIASYFSVSLNEGSLSEKKSGMGLKECIDLSFYTKLGIHKQMYWKTDYWNEPLFHFTGGGGEFLRALWYENPQGYLEKECKRGRRYRDTDYSDAVNRIVSSAYEKTMEKFPFADSRNPELTQLMYRETRCRHHFGKEAVEACCAGELKISPLMDACLGKIRNCTSGDANLLVAVIFTRYYPELLDYPFEGGRKIERETIEYAGKINGMLPFDKTDVMMRPAKKMVFIENREFYSEKQGIRYPDVEKFVYDAFQSERVRRMMAVSPYEEIYEFADKYSKTHSYFPLQEIYPVISIYIVQNMLQNHGTNPKQSIFEQMQNAVKGNFE